MLFDPDTVTQSYAVTADSSFVDSTLNEDGYAYAVRSVDHNGNVSDASNVVWVDLIVLDPPEITIAPQAGFLVLRWLPVPNANSYRILRSGSSEGPWEEFASTSGLSFVTTGDDPIQFFRVIAER